MTGTPKLEKVRDYHVSTSPDVASLLEGMGRGGGFMGRNLFDVASTFSAMCAREGCTKFLSFPAAIVATGLRGVLVDMVRGGLVDAIITTCGTLDHDIARTVGDYYIGSFGMDDARLKKAGYHRLGNVLVPLENYGPLIEKRMQPLLGRIYEVRRSVTTEELAAEIGRDLASERSLLYWAQKKGVPVFVPGITDGAVGSQAWLFSESHRDFHIDLLGDERRLSDIFSDAKETGALVLGGGISKHHTIWWAQFRGGLDWACYVSTAQETDGSLSGARIREAVSWGKVKVGARQATLDAEVTTVLPFIASYALTKRGRRQIP
ncbi:MAG: deoxyhypusine synthase [Nitrososphaerota archaeon]|nr:deoxyhypusine synthase [Nitrososphaerota archaeon]MDG6946122.1 deoxyhypusine synthase [Nitrososphaerota archaeon]